MAQQVQLLLILSHIIFGTEKKMGLGICVATEEQIGV